MASARLERTTVELTDGAGRAVLRATGQVVLFPGYLALYEEGRDEKADDEEGARMPALREGDAPAKTGVEATQHFTQPPPRYSEASLVKRMEELGIGRPSTYASILQTLKDREYVRVDKSRFIPEESGRLVTAFLERFFERYVNYDYTAELEEELDDVSGGRLNWQKLLEEFWHDFRPKAGEVMEQKPSEVTAALDEFLAPWLYPPREDGSDPRVCPACGNGRLSLRGGKFGAFVACSNYPGVPLHAEVRPARHWRPGERRPAGPRQRDRAQERAVRALSRARRQARVDPEGRAGRRRRCRNGREIAVAAARDWRAPGDGQDDQGVDRALRTVSRA